MAVTMEQFPVVMPELIFKFDLSISCGPGLKEPIGKTRTMSRSVPRHSKI